MRQALRELDVKPINRNLAGMLINQGRMREASFAELAYRENKDDIKAAQLPIVFRPW